MRFIFRAIAIILLCLGVLMFLYGSVKKSQSKQEAKTVNLTSDIRVVQDNSADKGKAEIGFTVSVIFIGAGVLMLIFVRGKKR